MIVGEAKFVNHQGRLRTTIEEPEEKVTEYGQSVVVSDYPVVSVSSFSSTTDRVYSFSVDTTANTFTQVSAWSGTRAYTSSQIKFTGAPGAIALPAYDPVTSTRYMDTFLLTTGLSGSGVVQVLGENAYSGSEGAYLGDRSQLDGSTLFTAGARTFPLSGVSAWSFASSSTTPTLLGNVTIPNQHGSYAVCVMQVGASRMVFSGSSLQGSPQRAYLNAIDATNPASMSIVGQLLLPLASNQTFGSAAKAVIRITNTMIGVTIENGFALVDVSNPASMSVIGTVSGGVLVGQVDAVMLTTNLVAWADQVKVAAINISNPAAPTVSGSLNRSSSGFVPRQLLRLTDTKVAATISTGGLAMFDYTNPAAIVRRTTASVGGTANSLDYGWVKGGGGT